MVASLPRLTNINTEMRIFHSSIMGENFQISAWFPPGYPKAGYLYPVIFLLDAEVLLGFISTMMYFYIEYQMIPSCLIIGVGHDIKTYDEWDKVRHHNLTPPEHPDLISPKRGDELLSFIKKELIPFVETNYPVNPADRCLAGYSQAGIFTLYALLHEPDLFQKYFIGSAIYENILPHLYTYEARLAEHRKSLPVRAFFSVGSLEEDVVPYFHQFIEAIKRRNYQDFRLETLVLEGENHASAVWGAYSQGLRALYKPE